MGRRSWGVLRGALLVTAGLLVADAARADEAPPLTLVHAGWLLAKPGMGAKPQRAVTILVSGDRIAGIRDGFIEAGSDLPAHTGTPVIIDLRDRYVLPGLADAHVHLSFQAGRSTVADRMFKTRSAVTLDALGYARATLAAGFTTVRDLASNSESIFALRDAINKGGFRGPRILASGLPISSTGGHGDFTIPGTPRAGPDESGICDGPDACRTAVREQIKRRADVIKMMSTGGMVSGTGMAQHYSAEEMRAIVETAHLRGIAVATHAYDPGAIRDAVRAGVDSVEHASKIDDEAIALMKERGTFLVPTLVVTSIYGSDKAVGKALAAGVPIAFGTDAGVGSAAHGLNAREFGLLVKAGLTPMQALESATMTAARLFRLEKEMGSIEPGKVADIIAVNADPIADVSVLNDVDWVMKSGRVFKTRGQVVAGL